MKTITQRLTLAILLMLCAAGSYAQMEEEELLEDDSALPLAAEPTVQPPAPGGGLTDGTLGTTPAGDAIIQYDAETDSIIIITDEETNSQIGRVIETLDRPVPQVLIKVLFLEITHTDALDLGVEGSYDDRDGSGENDQFLTDFGIDAASQGGFYRILNQKLNVTLRALAQQGKLEVLSRPSVLARNNETATITIGQEVPFIRNSRITDEGQTINTVEYEDIGIILEVTPHITSDRLVEMEVLPEISTLTAETVAISDTIDAPVIAKRSAQTRVVVGDGKTVVIGGLMEDNETEAVRKVPFLGDIPYLGVLFRRTITSKAKTELLIFLTPHVIETVRELDDRTEAEKARTELMPEAVSDAQRQKFLDEMLPADGQQDR